MKIKISLSERSINNAVKRLENYKNSLPSKTQQLEQAIADRISEVAQQNFNASQYWISSKEYVTPDVNVYPNPSGNYTVVIAHGTDAVWVEFGAGVYYNGSVGSSPHPKGSELGMTIGSYGKGYGQRRAWGYYGEDGTLIKTHGTPAQMPLWNAVQSVIPEIPAIARKVFKT